LEKLEQTPKEPTSDDSKASVDSVCELKKSIVSSVELLNVELGEVKSLLMSLQSFTAQTNEKLTDLIFTEQQKTEQQNVEENNKIDDPENESSGHCQNNDSEIVSESIDLKAFVETAI
jgi:hypothetical protein